MPKHQMHKHHASHALTPFEQRIHAFERMMQDMMAPFPSFFGDRETRSLWPKVDISETEKSLKIKADIPNVKPEDLDVEVEGNRLVIRGTTEKETEEKDETYYRKERERGSFYRAFDLPANVDAGKIKAEAKNGTVIITLPKKSAGETKKKIAVAKEK